MLMSVLNNFLKYRFGFQINITGAGSCCSCTCLIYPINETVLGYFYILSVIKYYTKVHCDIFQRIYHILRFITCRTVLLY